MKQAANTGKSPMKVLIADDYEDTLMILRASLESAGYAVSCAENGSAALAKARNDKPDIIISDILMPEMDGFDFCRQVKTDESLRDVPFIFYTATYLDEADKDLAMAAGASRFLIKPMNSAEFLDNMRSVVAESESHKLEVPVQPQMKSEERRVGAHASAGHQQETR